MTPVRFTDFAKADLVEIKSHYTQVAPASLEAVLTDIYTVIDIISQWPKVGHIIEPEGFRQMATPKYGFVLAYQITDTQIEVEGVFRFQNRRK